ncbi:MAG: NADH-quinone oxidoreductase subunit NuoH [Planctomycetota bacterium]
MIEWVLSILTLPYVFPIVKAVCIFMVILHVVPGLIYFERRICAWIQDRVGPNRVGPVGLLQPVADAIKLAFKEDLTPSGVDRTLYILAPVMAFVPAMLAFAVVPVGADLQVFSCNVGVIFVFTIGSFAVYGLAFGGWSSNSKYSLLGGLRSSAQMISYETALFLALFSALLLAGSLDLNDVVRDQLKHGWNLWRQPLASLLFLVAAFAETNRLPFDLAECESELVGGYHTEYSGLKFAIFFLGEYTAMITMSALFATLFLGGWSMPWFPQLETYGAPMVAISVLIFCAKVAALLFFFIWVRWTLPRFRYDQLMRLGWKVMIPLSLGNFAATAIYKAWPGK